MLRLCFFFQFLEKTEILRQLQGLYLKQPSLLPRLASEFDRHIGGNREICLKVHDNNIGES